MTGYFQWLVMTRRSGFIAAAALLVVMTLAAYIPAMHGGLIWDDDAYLTRDTRMESLGGLGRIWTDVVGEHYRHQYYPLTSSAFWVQHQLWGQRTFGYHLVNVLLHAANAVLLWRLLRTLRIPGAWVAAAIFAVHPVHVQSVAWITELKNVLSTLFFLSSALAFVRFFAPYGTEPPTVLRPVGRAGQWTAYGVGLVLFVCALLSKTATCSLPLALLLVLWWKRDRLGWRDLLPLVPLAVIAAALVSMTVYLESHYSGARGDEFSQSWIQRCLIAGRAIWFYAGKLAWPNRLTFIYPRWQIDPSVWWQYVYPLAVLVVVGVLWVLRHRIGKGPLAAVTYFIVAVAPMSFVGVYMTRFSYVADHWQYWASMGLISLAAAVGYLTADRLGRRAKGIATIVLVLVLTTFGTLTWRQSGLYLSQETLWRDTFRKNPGSWMVNTNLGHAMLVEGKVDEAVRHYREALQVKPLYAGTQHNMGISLALQGELDQAIRHFRQALRIKPDFADAHHNLGNALAMQGRFEEAIRHFHRALRLRPDYAKAHYNLGNALQSQGRIDEAIRHYHQALTIAPDFAAARRMLANLQQIKAQQRNQTPTVP